MNGMAPHRDRLSVVLFGGVLLALVAISLQLFGITYPALLDLPNHLARHAIQCGGGQAGGLGDYYEFGMRLVPNLTADIIYAFDWACRDIFLTNRILIQIAILNLIASVYVLHFVLWGRLSIWPAASCLLVYNTAFSFGFENYVLAAYIKKPEYGPSTIVAANLTIGEVGRGLCLVQAPCEIELDGKSIAGVEVDVKDLYDRKILGK